ncbi:MAG: hypothetical protein HC896_03235 [Bacteroidales bacterium]|nr:hypothetical protein [Bacteroidales bacterium]
MTVYSLINTVRAKGIKLWQENGQLKIKAPKGALTKDIQEQLTANKADIIAFFKPNIRNQQGTALAAHKQKRTGQQAT